MVSLCSYSWFRLIYDPRSYFYKCTCTPVLPWFHCHHLVYMNQFYYDSAYMWPQFNLDFISDPSIFAFQFIYNAFLTYMSGHCFCYNSMFNQYMNQFWLHCTWSYCSYASTRSPYTYTHTHKQRHIYIYIHTHVMLPFCLIYIYMYLSCGLWLIHIYIEAWFCAGSLSFMNVCLLILFLFWFHFDPCICKLFLLWYHFGQHICVTLVSDMTSSWFNNYIHDPWSYFHQYMYIPDPPWFRCYKHVYMFEFKSWSTTSKPSSQANNKRNKQACGGACMIFPGSFLLRNFTILISKQSIVFNVPCFGTIRN